VPHPPGTPALERAAGSHSGVSERDASRRVLISIRDDERANRRERIDAIKALHGLDEQEAAPTELPAVEALRQMTVPELRALLAR
jgi:hypothetical protein